MTKKLINLTVDLLHGFFPISAAAQRFARIIKWSRERQQPVIITRKGYPDGVLLDVGLYVKLRALADAALANESGGQRTSDHEVLAQLERIAQEAAPKRGQSARRKPAA